MKRAAAVAVMAAYDRRPAASRQQRHAKRLGFARGLGVETPAQPLLTRAARPLDLAPTPQR
jgi:hypothetical protein